MSLRWGIIVVVPPRTSAVRRDTGVKGSAPCRYCRAGMWSGKLGHPGSDQTSESRIDSSHLHLYLALNDRSLLPCMQNLKAKSRYDTVVVLRGFPILALST